MKSQAWAAIRALKRALAASGVGEAVELARLPRSTVVQSPTPVQMFGHDATQLRLRILNDCAIGDLYRVAETPRGTRGISYGDVVPMTVVIDFWVIDLDGVPVVVDMWHQEGASERLVDRIAAARDSITFVTAE